MKAISSLSVLCLLFLFNSAAAIAQGACDGLSGNAYGLCNAYCEAMDCDDPEHNASAKACDRVFMNFVDETGTAPPCNPCPCVNEANFPIFTDFEDGTTQIFSCMIESDTATGLFTVTVNGLSGDFAFAGKDATGGTVEAGCFAVDPGGNEDELDLDANPQQAEACANLLVAAAEEWPGIVCM